MKTENQQKIKNILKIVVTIIIIVTLFLMVRQSINNTEQITEITKSAGIYGPIVLIGLIMLGILFSPIPSVIIIITAGFIYGPIRGAIYSYIGHILGAILIYILTKQFKKTKEGTKFKKYKQFVKKNKNILFLLYIIPIIPITITTMIAATSKVEWKKFIEIIIISFLPAVMFFSFLGGTINQNNKTIIIGISLIIIIGSIFIIKKYKKTIEDEVEERIST